MPKAFDITNPPFDRLTPHEVETLRAALDIGYFSPGEAIISRDTPADALYVVIKGMVEERSEADLLALLGPKDTFDSRVLVHDHNGHQFLARDETLCYIIPKAVALKLIKANPRFAAFFYREISQKLDELANDEEAKRYGSLMHARVSELFLHPPSFVAARDTVEAAGHLMHDIDSNALFVRDGERIGIITGMNLSKAVVLRRQPIQTPVGEFANFDIVSVRPDDFVSSALLLMTNTISGASPCTMASGSSAFSRTSTFLDSWQVAPRSSPVASIAPPIWRTWRSLGARSRRKRERCEGRASRWR